MIKYKQKASKSSPARIKGERAWANERRREKKLPFHLEIKDATLKDL